MGEVWPMEACVCGGGAADVVCCCWDDIIAEVALDSERSLANVSIEFPIEDALVVVDEAEAVLALSNTLWNSRQVASTALRLCTYFSLSGASSIALSNASNDDS